MSTENLAWNLPALCRERNWRNLAFIGVSKHAGKTTALNAFIAQLQASGATLAAPSSPLAPMTVTAASHLSSATASSSVGIAATAPVSSPVGAPLPAECIGLLSIGLDGERLDTIMGIRKPPVHAPVGTLVASAEGALTESSAGLEYLEAMSIESPLGPVLIARVTRAGTVVLAGVRQRLHVQQVVARLRHHGATWCLVDGAFDRVAAAAPHLVDAAVLAVGATAGSTVDAVVAHATPVIQRFLLPEVSEQLRNQLLVAHERGEIGVLGHPSTPQGDTGGAAYESAQGGAQYGVPEGTAHAVAGGFRQAHRVVCLPKAVATSEPWLHSDWPGAVRAVYVPGALTASWLEGLSAHTSAPDGVDLVVAHPAQVLAPRAALEAWYRRGHRLFVWTPLPIAAIAVNPHSVNGADLPVADLAAAVQGLAPGAPVFDALAPDKLAFDPGASTAGGGLDR